MSTPIRDKIVEELIENKEDADIYIEDRGKYNKIAIKRMEALLNSIKINPKIDDFVELYDLLDAVCAASRVSPSNILAKRRAIKEKSGTYSEHYIKD